MGLGTGLIGLPAIPKPVPTATPTPTPLVVATPTAAPAPAATPTPTGIAGVSYAPSLSLPAIVPPALTETVTAAAASVAPVVAPIAAVVAPIVPVAAPVLTPIAPIVVPIAPAIAPIVTQPADPEPEPAPPPVATQTPPPVTATPADDPPAAAAPVAGSATKAPTGTVSLVDLYHQSITASTARSLAEFTTPAAIVATARPTVARTGAEIIADAAYALVAEAKSDQGGLNLLLGSASGQSDSTADINRRTPESKKPSAIAA